MAVTGQLILKEIFSRHLLPIAGSGAILCRIRRAAGYWSTPASLTLAAGNYDIGGWVDIGDPFIWFRSTVATDPRITFTEPVFIDSPSTAFPGLNTCCSTMGWFLRPELRLKPGS